MMNPLYTLHKGQGFLLISLFFLITGVVSLRLHYDFFAGLGIFAGVAIVAISTVKRPRAGV